ncbi:hypothetical protein [Xylanimonas protaetiae]|uniref:Uncharacterized protein n=1 Tax=Xylanimonas protaetiae TaxID=2509457 RepID=A0A4P6FAN2_9MICO|nr:hypothetical protein [Xylanimonas protaetiae]QAY70467.1 hypothetical protein ET471_10870 [Xylanimonas protaetiae]
MRHATVAPTAAPGAAPVAPAPQAPARVQRISAAQRMARSTAPTSPFAAAAPQPAPPMPRTGIPLQQVAAPEQGDWFAQAAAQQAAAAAPQPAAPSYAPLYVQQAYGQPPPAPAAQQYPAAQAYPPAGYAPPGQSYPGQSYPGQSYPGQSYPGQSYPGQPAPAPAEAPYAGSAPEAPARRKPTPGMVALTAFVAVLLVGAGVLAVNLFRGGQPADEADGPTAVSRSTTSPEPSAAPAQVLAEFASPTGNIVCQITTDAATCSIATLNQQPAPVEGCDGTVGYRVTMAAETGEVTLPCVPADQQPQPAAPGAQVLAYDQTITQGTFTCTSANTGMSCKDDQTGKGFSIKKAGIGTF